MKNSRKNGQGKGLLKQILMAGVITIFAFSMISTPVFAEGSMNVTNDGCITATPIDSTYTSGDWAIDDSSISEDALNTLDFRTHLLCSPYPLNGREVYFDESKYEDIDVMEYGCKKITGTTKAGTKVSVVINKKKYSCTAKSSGSFSIAIPLVKAGKSFYVKFVCGKESLTRKLKVVKNSDIYTSDWVLKNSKRVPIVIKNAHKGDIVKVTIGKKVYKKKITRNKKTYKLKIKIKKPGRYKIRMKTVLYNKYGQILAKEKEYVYLSNTVHVGDSKKKVKWLASWRTPVRKNQYTYSEQWCYDWDGDGVIDAYLYFGNNGKVKSWQIFNT